MTTQRLSNTQIVTMLKEVLAAMEVKNANRFRIKAYQNAIAIIDNLTTSVQDIYEDGRLSEIPGIGVALESHLNELFNKGVVKEFDEIKKGLPAGMFALLGIRGIGAKKAFKLAASFKLENRETAIEDLKKHAEKGNIRVLEGFGEKSENDVLEAIETARMSKREKPRMLLYKAELIIDRLLAYMKTCPQVNEINALGSYRRRNPTIGDLDLVASSVYPEEVLNHFAKYPEVGTILAKGDRKMFVLLTNDVQVDLYISDPESYGAMLQYNTGSKQHNIILRTYALSKGMSLSEHGIKQNGELLKFKDEPSFYKHLGLPYIQPELRQGTDEVELARRDALPNLVQLKDIKGDLQAHTVFSDGVNSLDEMVEGATTLGYAYFGLTDHAPSVISRGYKEVEKLLISEKEKYDNLNKSQKKTKVLFGLEINILADVTLGLPNELLALLDFAAGSIHTAFTQDKQTITKRYTTAIENPYINYIAHPTGRLINERAACDVDWNVVFDALVANDKLIEINSQPSRLDLTEDLVRLAIKKGVKLLINTDAHAVDQLKFMKYGVDVARRGFGEQLNFINTLPFNIFASQFGLRNWKV